MRLSKVRGIIGCVALVMGVVQAGLAADVLIVDAKSQPESLTMAPGGVMYVTNVVFNNLYRIPVDATGKPGTPVDIWMDQPVKGPDGMRAANGRLIVAENGSGKITAITVNGDKASVTVLKEGLKTPTGVEPAGDTIWISERGAGKAVSIPLPK